MSVPHSCLDCSLPAGGQTFLSVLPIIKDSGPNGVAPTEDAGSAQAREVVHQEEATPRVDITRLAIYKGLAASDIAPRQSLFRSRIARVRVPSGKHRLRVGKKRIWSIDPLRAGR